MGKRKELIVVAGANGTGKTTFANEYVGEHGVSYIGADAIAQSISASDPTKVRILAGKQFAAEVNSHLGGNKSFLVESTLSGQTFRKTLKQAQDAQFRIVIFYLFVDSPETCLTRIEQRVRKGGHHVPEADVRRRFARSLTNFWNTYRNMADNWIVMYNAPHELCDVVAGSREASSIRDTAWFARFRSLLEAYDAR